MESSVFKQIARFLQEKKKEKQWLVVFICMAVVVGSGTVAALKLKGQAMTHKEKVVACSLEVHQHTDACYGGENGELNCGYADYVVHVHNDDCYDWNGNLTCTLPEIEKHTHTDACYTEEKNLICGLEETAGHQHGAECHTTQQGDLVCQLPEHQHDESCYDETGAVVCEIEEHLHEDTCYEWLDVLSCQLPEGADGHTHTDECYEVKSVLSCGQLELHTHTDACYEKIDETQDMSEQNRRLVCTIPQLEEHIHTEDAGCFKTVEVTANGELVDEDMKDESEEALKDTTDESEDTEEEDEKEQEIFTTDLNGEDTEDVEEDAEDVKEDTEDVKEEASDYEFSKTCENEKYIVTVVYNQDANIPDEAELVAEQLAEESDGDPELQGEPGKSEITMTASFRIGFYVDGEEINPEAPISITIQYLDGMGQPKGEPIRTIR